MKIYPLGTEQDPKGLRLQQLMNHPNTHAVDCRFNPWSTRTIWQKPTLIQQFGDRYHTAGAYLGNAKHPSNMMFSGKVEIELISPDIGIAGLMRFLTAGYDLVLIGHYRCIDDSHLTEVIRLLRAAMPDLLVMLEDQTPMPSRGHIKVGAKVFLCAGKEQTPAVILQTGFTSTGDYLLCWLMVAKQNPLNGGTWLTSAVGPIQSYKLKTRPTIIPALDKEEA